MNITTINKVNEKLKNFPEKLLEEVENYIDFLSFKYLQEDSSEIYQWQKDILMDRIDHPLETSDAFEMLEEVERE